MYEMTICCFTTVTPESLLIEWQHNQSAKINIVLYYFSHLVKMDNFLIANFL